MKKNEAFILLYLAIARSNLQNIIEIINMPVFKRQLKRNKNEINYNYEKDYNDIKKIFQDIIDKYSPVKYRMPDFEYFDEDNFDEILEKNNENFKMILRNIDKLEKYLFE